MSYAFTLFVTLAICFAAQSLALRAFGGRTAKSESNFFSSIGRIQAGAQGNPEVMVLGSSITGRLPDRAQGFDGWSNMGCDGGCAMDALRAMDAGILPSAPLLIIEANTLHMAMDGKPTEISKAMGSLWFRMGMKFPQLSAYARPSAFVYSKLLERRIGSFSLGEGEDLRASAFPEAVKENLTGNSDPKKNHVIREMSGILARLRVKGCQSAIVWLPPARADGSPPPSWILEMAQQCGITYWDLGQQAADGTVKLTDAVHMDAPSAARTMNSLRSALPRFSPDDL